MTLTQNNLLTDTQAVPFQGKLVENVELISLPPGTPDTRTPPRSERPMISSTQTAGTVWLRYSVEREYNGVCDSSTQA